MIHDGLNTDLENPNNIKNMLKSLDKFDKISGQTRKKIFPEVANFYHRYF